MGLFDCCDDSLPPIGGFAPPVDNGDGTQTTAFIFTSQEGGGPNTCTPNKVRLTVTKKDGSYLGGYTFCEGDDLATATPIATGQPWSTFAPYITGTVVDGGVIDLEVIKLLKALNCFDDTLLPGEKVGILVYVSVIDCTTGETNNPQPTDAGCFEVMYNPPVTEVTAALAACSNDQADFTGSFLIQDYAGAPLGDNVDDSVKVSIISATTGTILGTAEFAYGDDLSSATPKAGTDVNWTTNLAPYFGTGSLAVDGGGYTFDKYEAAKAYNNANGGSLAGVNKGEDWIFKMDGCDADQCSVNNSTVTGNIEKVEQYWYPFFNLSRGGNLPYANGGTYVADPLGNNNNGYTAYGHEISFAGAVAEDQPWTVEVRTDFGPWTSAGTETDVTSIGRFAWALVTGSPNAGLFTMGARSNYTNPYFLGMPVVYLENQDQFNGNLGLASRQPSITGGDLCGGALNFIAGGSEAANPQDNWEVWVATTAGQTALSGIQVHQSNPVTGVNLNFTQSFPTEGVFEISGFMNDGLGGANVAYTTAQLVKYSL